MATLSELAFFSNLASSVQNDEEKISVLFYSGFIEHCRAADHNTADTRQAVVVRVSREF